MKVLAIFRELVFTNDKNLMILCKLTIAVEKCFTDFYCVHVRGRKSQWKITEAT